MRMTLLLITRLIAVIALIITETVMAEDFDSNRQPLVLEPEPLARKDILATLDIASKQERMGSGGPLRIQEGELTMGKLILYSLKVPKAPIKDTARLLSTPNSKLYRYYLVIFPFTLSPPPPNRRYKEMIFKIVVSNPQITAFELLPKEVTREEEVTQVFDIGFSVSLSDETDKTKGDIGVSAKETQTVKFTRLRPIIKSFGDRQNDFFWQFTSPSDSPVEPGSRRTAAILQVPSGVNQLSGTILWQVSLERRFFEDWLNIPVTVDVLPFELQLN